jgi:Zn-dependent protease with chaperone function
MTHPSSRPLLASALHAGALWLCGLILTSHSLAVRAQSTVGKPLVAEIPAQALTQALEDFSRQTGLQVAYPSSVVGNRTTRGAPAGLTPEDALERLLRGTGLEFEFLSPRLIRIGHNATSPPSHKLPAESDEVVINALAVRNRSRLAPASPQELHAMEAANEELERRIARCGLLYGNAALDQYLQGIAERLLGAEAANAADAANATVVRVRVIRGGGANAFSLSDGSVYVTTAMLASLDDESEVAAVLSHELTHYTNAHVLRALRDEHREVVSANAGLLLLGFFGATYPIDLARVPQGALGILQRASVSGYSPDLEHEADVGGIQRLVDAGYDASGALAALQHLQTTADSSPELPAYASHAKLARRLTNYRDLMSSKEMATRVAAGGETRRAEYRGELAGLPLDQVAILIESGQFDRAETALEAVMETGDSGRAEFLEGEIARKRVPQSDATVERALAAYALAIGLPDAPAATWREVGLLRRLRGESADAARAFQGYLERAPTAADAPLIRRYLEDARQPATPAVAVTAP